MRVLNVHERVIAAASQPVGALLDSLASPNDRLWPHDRWPAMRFDHPLGVGADGGHGPVRYRVETYEPGRAVRFRFRAPRGFHGTHGFDVAPLDAGRTRLRHTLQMDASGPALLTWPLAFRPLHDALIEDSLDRAERSLGLRPAGARWSARVRLLRRLFGARTAGAPRSLPPHA